ncbi:hypothetical protein E2C01_023321 [Portunus trituberculatus]|uniref:Uncharacterized protein n=1 Tax=Portunus trituberculatus TaxID=210409 RepID=A0A5B7E9N8_PORTR|nr:hypothetical protein [Portunus trituberculatus]
MSLPGGDAAISRFLVFPKRPGSWMVVVVVVVMVVVKILPKTVDATSLLPVVTHTTRRPSENQLTHRTNTNLPTHSYTPLTYSLPLLTPVTSCSA